MDTIEWPQKPLPLHTPKQLVPILLHYSDYTPGHMLNRVKYVTVPHDYCLKICKLENIFGNYVLFVKDEFYILTL